MDVSRRHHWFPRRNDALEKSAERVTTQIWVALLIGRSRGNSASTNQKHYPDLGSDALSVRNFCARFSDDISQENQRWRSETSAVFSG